jgi:glycolate dehydrogenase FAD-linked subunit
VLAEHAGDKWFAAHKPEAVVFAGSTESVVALLRFANRHSVPVTPRGAGHGYVGGCVPARGGIVLSLARMDRIKEISPSDFVAVVEAGVNSQKLADEVEKQGLFYPPDPASRKDNAIGGNISTNAGGPRCLKYGVTRDYVLGLEVVLADGTVVRLGGRTHKNKTGFDLHRLFVGSEGLLGIITEATLKLLPLPPHRACLAIGFDTMRAAVRSVHAILGAGFLPAALEIADAFTLAAAYRRTKSERLRGCRAHLIVELDGQPRSVRGEVRDVQKLVLAQNPLFVEVGLGASKCEEVWQIRREFSYALRDTGLTKLNEDIVVPRGRLEDLFAFAARLQKRHGLAVACFGHAGDGNIHTNVMVDFGQPGAKQRSDAALDELFTQVLQWGGAITGEHGIGLAKKPWWRQALSSEARDLHRVIKKALDPKRILNPGKFI